MTITSKKPDIIPAQRLNLILELIRQKGVITTHELSDITGVSLPTVRRDLDRLAETGAVQRSHGGATLRTPPGTTHEPDSHIAARIAMKEKMAIGKHAADQLRENQSVIFDSSSTVYEAARQVLERGLTLTAVTNDLRIGEMRAAWLSSPAAAM